MTLMSKPTSFKLLNGLPFFLELFINGGFVALYVFRKLGKLPSSWDLSLVDQGLNYLSWFVPLVIFFVVVVCYNNSKNIEYFFRKYIFSIIIFFPMLSTFGDLEFTFRFAAVHLVATLLSLNDWRPTRKNYGEQDYVTDLASRLKVFFLRVIRPKFGSAQIILVFFALVILIGGGLLMTPFASSSNKSIEWVDALFMATSATCVTGLATISVGGNLSFFGQFVLLVLIQIGGLGYMIFYTMLLFRGSNFDYTSRKNMQDILDVSDMDELMVVIRDIITYTVTIEAIGGVLLSIGFLMEGLEPAKAIYYGFFHSISAFCNAGFGMFDDNMESFNTNPLISLVLCALIVLGGLGFIVLRELREIVSGKKTMARMSINTKMVGIYTIALVVGGTLFIFFAEFLHSLDGYSLGNKLMISLFQSVTTRTAGFNSIPLTSFHNYTIYIMTILMFIGAASGSTAGGIKVSTLAILIQSIKAALKGSPKVEFYDREIPPTVVVRATALTILYVFVALLFTFIMMKIEREQHLLTLVFEVISALGTVGLSLGLTPFLDVAGKITIALVMFIGRTGPLTLILALGQRHSYKGQYSYPQGRVMIG